MMDMQGSASMSPVSYQCLELLRDRLHVARHPPHRTEFPALPGLVPILERLTSHQWASSSAAVAPNPAGSVGGAKRQAVLRQIAAQRQALALLSRNAPLPAELLQAVGPPTSDYDPAVGSHTPQ